MYRHIDIRYRVIFQFSGWTVLYWSSAIATPWKKGRKGERRVEKIERRSTQDRNALGAQHSKGPFFLSRRLFECVFKSKLDIIQANWMMHDNCKNKVALYKYRTVGPEKVLYMSVTSLIVQLWYSINKFINPVQIRFDVRLLC